MLRFGPIEELGQCHEESETAKNIEGVGNVVGGLYDFRLPRTDDGFGPLKTAQDFHKFSRNDLKRLPNLDPEVDRMIELHGDTRDKVPRNSLLQRTYRFLAHPLSRVL